MTINHDELGSGVKVTNLHFAKRPDGDFADCDARDCNAIGAELPRATFRNADLRGALLCHCDLRDADFSGADLTDANLHGSDCVGATFIGAVLDRVCWHNCTAVPKEADSAAPWVPPKRIA